MIRHILRLMWHRKRHNALVALEVFFSFLVLLGVVMIAVLYASNYRHPLGYDIDRVWRVDLRTDWRSDKESERERGREAAGQVILSVRALPEVEAVAAAFTAPYENASWTSGITVGGKEYSYGANEVTDDYRDVIDLKVVQGRWFSREDDGAPWRPVVVNLRLAHEMFGDADPVGRSIRRDPNPRDAQLPAEERDDLAREMRVVGVIEDFRQHGELSMPEPFMFERLRLDDPTKGAPRALVLKVRRGTTAQFEETLVAKMQAAAREWSFDVQTVEALRDQTLRQYLTPLVALAVVAGFLLVMVALGLTGVLWQSVTQRTREIGLRRAKGATRSRVHGQIVGELAIVTTVALLLGVALVVQAPLLPVPASLLVPRPVLLISLGIAAAIIYGISFACAWYPSRMATRIEPADALRYE